MQTTGFVTVRNEQTLVLVRANIHRKRFGIMSIDYVSLKIRKSGAPGQYLTDESAYLSDNPDLYSRLKNGETIKM